MTHWTEQQLAEYHQKYDKEIKPFHPDTMEADEGPESNLQKKIVKWADQKGYPCLSFKKSKKAIGYLKPGWPDISLALPMKRTLWIELKAEKGELRKAQNDLRIMFLALGHEWYLVRSYKRFLEIINK